MRRRDYWTKSRMKYEHRNGSALSGPVMPAAFQKSSGVRRTGCLSANSFIGKRKSGKISTTEELYNETKKREAGIVPVSPSTALPPFSLKSRRQPLQKHKTVSSSRSPSSRLEPFRYKLPTPLPVNCWRGLAAHYSIMLYNKPGLRKSSRPVATRTCGGELTGLPASFSTHSISNHSRKTSCSCSADGRTTASSASCGRVTVFCSCISGLKREVPVFPDAGGSISNHAGAV